MLVDIAFHLGLEALGAGVAVCARGLCARCRAAAAARLALVAGVWAASSALTVWLLG